MGLYSKIWRFWQKSNSSRTSKRTSILHVPPNFPSHPPFLEALQITLQTWAPLFYSSSHLPWRVPLPTPTFPSPHRARAADSVASYSTAPSPSPLCPRPHAVVGSPHCARTRTPSPAPNPAGLRRGRAQPSAALGDAPISASSPTRTPSPSTSSTAPLEASPRQR
jgi:hypothetical protein